MNNLHGSVIVTYRCNAKCNMCDCFKDPSKKEEEISIEVIRKLPKMKFTNITGGEPMIREDIGDIILELYRKTNRIVMSTNGYFTDKIIQLCEQFPNLGIRISIEGMQKTNDEIRGIKGGFDRGLRCLLELTRRGHKDIGFGMTVQDMNADDLLLLYKLSDHMGMEFATAALHNSFYFRKTNNRINDTERVAKAFEALVNELLTSSSPKKWFRAYFNHGLINYIYDRDRLLPCEMGRDGFFLDPFADVLPCNGMSEKKSMGNLNTQTFEEIWNSKKAEDIRAQVGKCPKNCWMIGSAAPAIKKRLHIPIAWILKHKVIKRNYDLKEISYIKE